MAYRLFRASNCFMKCSVVRNPRLKKKYYRHCSNVSIRQESLNLGNAIKANLNKLVQWYEETTGMDEVRMAQKRVLDAEEKFISAQDRRRETNKELNVIQNKLKDLYAELDNTSRGEDRYVALITEEHKLLKQERLVVDEFKRFEREEREHFSALSSAVKESHEKERAQAERTKYWSIIGSILGTIIGIIGSSINNELKMKELRKLLKESTLSTSTSNTEIPEILLKHDQKLKTLTKEINASSQQNYEVVSRLNNVISTLESDTKLDAKNVLNALSQHQMTLEKNLKEMNKLVLSQLSREIPRERYTLQPSDENIDDPYATTKLLFLSSVIFIFPVVFSYFGLFS